METSITNDKALFSNLSGVLNSDWHYSVPILNFTVKPNELETDFIPHIYKIGTHASFLSTAWVFILTLWLSWMTWRFIGMPVLIQAIPRVIADDLTVLTLEAIENCLLLTIMLLMMMIIMILKRNNSRSSTQRKGDLKMECDPASEIRINIFEKAEEA